MFNVVMNLSGLHECVKMGCFSMQTGIYMNAMDMNNTPHHHRSCEMGAQFKRLFIH